MALPEPHQRNLPYLLLKASITYKAVEIFPQKINAEQLLITLMSCQCDVG